MLNEIKKAMNISGNAKNDDIQFWVSHYIQDLKSLGVAERKEEDPDFEQYVGLLALYVKPKIFETFNLAQNVIDERTSIRNRFIFSDAIERDQND